VKGLDVQTLYEILEVAPDAPGAEIEKAYERAVALYGPGSLATYTLMSPDDAALLTRRIDEARQTLLDPAARARYDESLGPAAAQGVPPAGSAPPAEPVPALVPLVSVVPVPAEPVASPGQLLAAAADAAGPAPDAAPIPLRNEVPVPPAERDVVVPEGAAWTGEILRQVREARGLSVQQIAERTRVTRHHIENIERDRFGLLPAPVYLRGILTALARELRLDGQKVARSYLERIQASGAPAAPPVRPR
jgi:curved DNA-binding protein CbpA